MIDIVGNTIKVPVEFLSEFCQSVDKAISEKEIIYCAVKNNQFSLYSMSKSGSFVCLEVPVEYGQNLSFGIDAERFLAFVKKLYPGTVTIKVDTAKIDFKEGNIKATFPVVAVKSVYVLPKSLVISGEACQWMVESLVSCLNTVAETAKPNPTGKLLGILFDTKNGISRIGKFSQISLYLASHEGIIHGDFRTILPDDLAKLARGFSGDIASILLGTNQVGVKLNNGTEIYVSKPHDTYPLDYLSYLNLSTGMSLIPEQHRPYVFKADSLVNAIDLVSGSLGNTDSWVSISPVGKTSEGSLVWRVGGKSYTGMEVSEEIASTDGEIIEGFGINKQRSLKGLSAFKGDVYLYNISASVVALSSESGRSCLLMTKTRV